jgi:hypothetical protein
MYPKQEKRRKEKRNAKASEDIKKAVFPKKTATFEEF